jgi:DNA-binding Lrp family transcriptional regulator
MIAMGTAIKSPKPLQLSQKAELVPEARLEEWRALALQTQDLSELDRAMLDIIFDWHRRMQDDGCADRITFEKMSSRVGVEPMRIRRSVRHLVDLGVIAIKPGGGPEAAGIPVGLTTAYRRIDVDRGR